MLLALDVGNTNIKMGVYDNNELVFHARLTTDKFKTSDEYTIELHAIFSVYKFPISNITGAVIACVVPQIVTQLTTAIKNVTGVDTLVVGPGVKTGLDIKLNNPASTGADLVASCVAAIETYPCPCIIVCLGTATTIIVLDETKAMIGGLLMPGVMISLNALTTKTALLPNISLEAPKNIIGKTTEDCMKSGCVIASACMIDSVCDKIEKEINKKCTVIATGGLSGVIIPSCQREIIIKDELILDGLNIIYNKNKI